MGKRMIKSHEVIYKDAQGVERKRTVTKEIVHKSDEESFYMSFINYIKWIYNIKSGATHLVLHYLLEHAEYNTGEVHITTGERTKILQTCDITKSSLTKSLQQLITLGVIIQKKEIDKDTGEEIILKGDYIINPEMFWKGPLNSRKSLKVTFEAEYIPNKEFDEQCES